jgi:two-component system NtrC family sensor kinase
MGHMKGPSILKRSCPNRIKKISSYPKLVEEFQSLTNRILQFAHQGPLRPHFQQEVSRMILDFSGADEVELWLKDHGKYFRSVVKRQSPPLFLFNIRSSAQNENGEISPLPDDDPDLIWLCNNLIRSQVDRSPMLTNNGSFLIADSKKPISLRLKSSPKANLRKLIIGGLHSSLFLIPLWVSQQNIGLLQLKSNLRNFFKKERTGLYESLARSLEIAAAHRDAQIDLRERVKELSCLYGIAHLVSQPGITLEGILNGIARLLPSAWLYPDITRARIILDGHSYSPPPFVEGKWKQTADIVIHQKTRGRVEIFYIEEKPELDEGPFMREERSLLDTIAKEVAIIVMRKEAEHKKTELEEQLRHAERLAAIGQLSASIAHELNEPLGNILGFAQLAKKSPGLPRQAELDIEKILTASLNARETVKKLLIFARKLPPKMTKVNVNPLVKEAIHFFESRCFQEGIELSYSLDPDLPEILADPVQFNQVMVNLIINALQAMKGGGRLTVQTCGSKEFVTVIIEDTGVGMTEEVMENIFTPFFTTKDVGQGTGLGLPVVHGIVTSHGGSIKVDSKPNQGSRFEIQWPIAESSEVQAGP